MVNVKGREIEDTHDFVAIPASQGDDDGNVVIIGGEGPHAGAGRPPLMMVKHKGMMTIKTKCLMIHIDQENLWVVVDLKYIKDL